MMRCALLLNPEARGLVDPGPYVVERVTLDAFGVQFGPWTGPTNPYRGVYPDQSRRGAAWAYTTDPSGLLQ